MSASFWPKGLKRTRQRQAVMRVLEESPSPLSALDIYGRLEREGQGVWLSTVYRILELLTERGVAVKTGVQETGMAYYELRRPGHRHYAVCLGCHKMVAIEGCPLAALEPGVAGDDFRVLGHRLEMYGYCRDCNIKEKQATGR